MKYDFKKVTTAADIKIHNSAFHSCTQYNWKWSTFRVQCKSGRVDTFVDDFIIKMVIFGNYQRKNARYKSQFEKHRNHAR